MLFAVTSVIDFLSMAVAFWLALYLLGRGVSSRITLRGVVVLLSLSVFFLVAYLSLYQQVPGMTAIRAVFLTVGLSLWHDLTHKFLPSWYQKTQRWQAGLIYAFGFINIVVLLWTRIGFVEEQGDLLWMAPTNIRVPEIINSVFQISASTFILYGFRTGTKFGAGLQNRQFLLACLLVAAAMAYNMLALAAPLLMPVFIFDLLILCGTSLLGFSVARYQVMIERRASLRDFSISALIIFVLADIYLFLAWQMGLSPLTLILVTALTILTHSTYHLVHEFLDRSRSRDLQPDGVNIQTGSEQLPTTLLTNPDPQFIKSIEDGLRNLTDFSILGQSSLPECLGISGETHLEKGKAVQQRLIEAIEALRPAKDCPKEPIPREWHSYVVLYDAYWQRIPNHDIMSKLFISEGTFHRTRRAAVRSVARVLLEKKKLSSE